MGILWKAWIAPGAASLCNAGGGEEGGSYSRRTITEWMFTGIFKQDKGVD